MGHKLDTIITLFYKNYKNKRLIKFLNKERILLNADRMMIYYSHNTKNELNE